ncbi:MAG: chorismate synthase [Chthoniobacterales bacterium]|nr:chorismate synthase [Chthoniobacterales bacterium]
MASNSFGTLFRITTWGESHGKAIGVVIDGCPAGLEISEEEINAALAKRAPGKNAFVTPRAEPDLAVIYSGVFEGKTTGTPISIIIFNQDADSSKYEAIKNQLRPGHANFTYLEKYGFFDARGGGRASARETACRVAAGAIAKKLLKHSSVQVTAFLNSVADVEIKNLPEQDSLRALVDASQLFCPDAEATERMIEKIEAAKTAGDSLGGTVGFVATGLPVGLGDPIYEKLEANLAKAMMSLPASKGFEIGEGFNAGRMTGSTHNDLFIKTDRKIQTESNRAGGTLGGISTGMPLCGRVAFKPTSSIKLPQESLDLQGVPVIFQLPEGSRHDPCVAIRAVPVVEAMVVLVLADALLLNRSAQLSTWSK